MGGAHPKLNQAAGKGNDPKWGEFVGDTAPWNRFPWGFVTPCKKYFICPSGRLYHSEEQMHSFQGPKMENGVCCVHCITLCTTGSIISLLTLCSFQIVCSRWAEPTLTETRLRGKAMIHATSRVPMMCWSGVLMLATWRRGIGTLGDL